VTGLKGLTTNGFVKKTLPDGEVKRKIDQENHSSVGFFDWASVSSDQAVKSSPTAAANDKRLANDVVIFSSL